MGKGARPRCGMHRQMLHTALKARQRAHTLLGFCTPPEGRFRTSFWLDSSNVGEAGFRAVRKLKATCLSEARSQHIPPSTAWQHQLVQYADAVLVLYHNIC